MSTKNNAGKAAGQAAALPAADAQRLSGAIKDMDAMSQEGFNRIEALARVALMALETPAAHRAPEMLAGVLEAIASTAQASRDAVACSAEDVGCRWVIRSELRRLEAARKAAALIRGGGAS